jgi:unsaturated rhamnogalacturonyl hydrolase
MKKYGLYSSVIIFSFFIAIILFSSAKSFAGAWEKVNDPIVVAKAVADRELFGRVIEDDNERPDFKVHHNLLWEDGTLMAGVFALYDRTEELGKPVPRYLDYIGAYADRNPGKFLFPLVHGDQVCAGQTYIWLYERSGKTSKHLKLTNGMVEFLSYYDFKPMQADTQYRDYWMRFWQDDMHMVPPFLAMRGRAAGSKGMPGKIDARDVAMIYCRAYWDILGDKDTGLYFHNRDALGEFHWGRGNGWVAAGHLKVMRVLEEDPAYSSDAAWLEERLLQMAAALKDNRNNVGTWNADVINREKYVMPETSGTSFFTYMMANMLNNGQLSEDYLPVVQKSWNFLRMSVQEDGTLMRVQPVGRGPIQDDFEMLTETYGVGGFLLSAVEMSKMTDDVNAKSIKVECVEACINDISTRGADLVIPTDIIAAKAKGFPKNPEGKVQAVIPGARLPVTKVNINTGKIVLKDASTTRRNSIYIFYKP